MKRKFTLVALYVMASILTCQAQPWRSTAATPNIHESRQEFEQWKAAHPEYRTLKGWKPTERWLWFQENHTDASGNTDAAARGAYENLLHHLGGQKVQSDGGNWGQMNLTNPINIGWVGRISCVMADPTDTLKIYVGTPDGGIWRSNDGGVSGWTPLSDQLPTIGVSSIAIDPTNTSTMYIATGDRDQGDVGVASDSRSVGLLKTFNGGTTWVPTGINWTVQNPVKVNKVILDATNSSHVIVATGANLQKSTDAGGTWTVAATDNFLDVVQDPVTSANMYAVAKTQFYRSTNNGSTFVAAGTGLPSGASVGRIAISANGTYVYALVADNNGNNVGFYRSSDQGATFAPQNTTTTLINWAGYYNLTVWSSTTDPNLVYAGAVVLSRSTDGGVNWTTGVNGNFVDHHDITRIGNAIVVGADQGVFYTYDQGSTWSQRNTGLHVMQHYRMDVGTNPNHRITTGVQDIGGLYYSNGLWGTGSGGDGTGAAVDKVDPNILWSASYNSVNASTDGGATWPYTNINAVITGEPYHWVFPIASDPTTSGRLYVGYVNLYSTTTYGNTWLQRSSFTDLNINNTIVSIAVSPSNGDYIWLCKKDSVLRTTNGGTSWQNVTGMSNGGNRYTDVWVHSTNPDHAWVSVAGYSATHKVYATTDGGATWTNLSVGLPNIPANCGVYYPGSGDDFFLGMDDGVYHYSAVTGLWTTYSYLLPKAIVTDLAVNTALSMVYASTFGRGIWNSPLGLVTNPEASADQPSILLYPNPAHDQFTIRYDLKGLEKGTLRLVDAQGKLLMERTVQESGKEITLERSMIPAGVYFVSLQTEKGIQTRHLVLD